ncbi:MAG: ATP-binding protein [Saccharospirillum sp.]|uniref:sensor histidine kinase n=1 Tax=Saccharospirillum sp. TaxID=2033801 RepID=UPI00349FD51B
MSRPFMMLRSLYARLSLGLFVLLVAVGLVYATISLFALRSYQASVNQELNRNLAMNLVLDQNLVNNGELNFDELDNLFSLYMSINPSIEIYLIDTEGNILSYSADPDKIKRNSVSMAPIRRLLSDPDAYPLLGDDPRSHDRQKVFSVTPVPSADDVEGYLYVVLRGEEYDSAELMARESQFFIISAWAVAVSLGIGLLAGLAVFHLLTRRLRRLADRLDHFQNQLASDTSRLPNPAGDEIDTLASTFERMSTRITLQLEQLQEKDALRRQLVAQVSHDLRTPLASLQGYVESLLIKRDSLSDEEQTRFLTIALNESRRLGRLVDELFELAALEAQEKQPAPEPFSLPELIHDVVQKHLSAANSRNLTLSVEGDLALPQAYADLGMTERVLDNLISNAMDHTPENGRIELTLAQTEEQVTVTVHDTGPGIAPEDLPFIFDAFHRGPSERSSAHAGLGLAIARRIMELQQGSISAFNHSEQGAEFVVRLPLAATVMAHSSKNNGS